MSEIPMSPTPYKPHLPIMSGAAVMRVFAKNGFTVVGATELHWVLRCKYAPQRQLIIIHDKALAQGCLRRLIHHSGLSEKEFLFLL